MPHGSTRARAATSFGPGAVEWHGGAAEGALDGGRGRGPVAEPAQAVPPAGAGGGVLGEGFRGEHGGRRGEGRDGDRSAASDEASGAYSGSRRSLLRVGSQRYQALSAGQGVPGDDAVQLPAGVRGDSPSSKKE